MDRVVLERAWADSYDFDLDSIPAKVKALSAQPSKVLAEQVYEAAMELRAEEINWYGSDFEEELLDVVNKGDVAITNPDKHISLMEYKEIVELRQNLEDSVADETLENKISDAKGRAVEVSRDGSDKEME